MKQNLSWQLYCDGASSGNPGPGGYAFHLVDPQGEVTEGGGYETYVTNNQMEIRGLIAGLESLSNRAVKHCVVHLDSQYVLQGATKWRKNWLRNGFLTQSGQPVANQDLWRKLSGILDELESKGVPLEWKHVKGHSGDPRNDRVDELAVAYSKQKKLGKFEIREVSSDYPDPPLKFPFYAAKVAGKITYTAQWSECERHVKGAAGAQFKKIKSLEEWKNCPQFWNSFPRG